MNTIPASAANNSPKFSASRVFNNGNAAIEFVVRNSIECIRLNIVPTVGMTNRRSIVCTTKEEVKKIQNAMRKFFKS